MSSVKSIIDKAKDYYFNHWRGHEKVSPAFGEKVFITKLGWNHIAKHKRRLLVDKLIRLKKLPLAREVLETATTYQTVTQRGKYLLYGFRAIKDRTVIKAVVSSKGTTGRKVLYSVMFKSLDRQVQRRTMIANRKLVVQFRKRNPRPR